MRPVEVSGRVAAVFGLPGLADGGQGRQQFFDRLGSFLAPGELSGEFGGGLRGRLLVERRFERCICSGSLAGHFCFLTLAAGCVSIGVSSSSASASVVCRF